MAVELRVQIRPPGSVRQSVCSVAARREWSVEDAKEAVEVQAGIPASEQRLLFESGGRGRELRGPAPLDELLPPGSKAKLRLVRRAPEHSRWLNKVAERGSLVCAAGPAVKKDREVALRAVRDSGRALQFLSRGMRADREIVLAAVAQDGYALRFASRELRADREVVLAAVQSKGLALHFASEPLRKDREVVMAAAGQDGASLQFAAPELRGDVEAKDAAASTGASVFSAPSRRLLITALSADHRWPHCRDWSPVSSLDGSVSFRESSWRPRRAGRGRR